MPKNKLQDVIFTFLMAAVMVYGMVCYNISLETGGLNDAVFILAPARMADHDPGRCTA